MLAKFLPRWHSKLPISMQKIAISMLFAFTVFDYLIQDDPFVSISFRFLLLACAFAILWLRHNYDMLLVFSLVFVAGIVLRLFLGKLGVGLSIVLFPIVGIMFVLSRAGRDKPLNFPPIKFSFLLNTAVALLFGTTVSIMVFFYEINLANYNSRPSIDFGFATDTAKLRALPLISLRSLPKPSLTHHAWSKADEFPFELLISTFLLFGLWSKVGTEQKGTRTEKLKGE